MSTTALILILVSAVAHAGWNFYGKKFSPTIAFFFLVTLGGSILFSPVFFWNTELLGSINVEIFCLLLATGFFQCLYLYGLASAYRAGDMSIAYPIARSSPLIIVCISAFLLGQRDAISGQAIAGIVLIVGGCLLIPIRSLREIRAENYLNATTAFALLAAFATAGYSLVDDHATTLLRNMTTGAENSPVADSANIAMVYVVLQGFSASVWMAALVYLSPKDRRLLPELMKNAMGRSLLTAAMMFGTYALVVTSMAYASNVSYVVAFRQISIPIGVMMSVVGFGEKLYWPKLLGVAITFSGLIAVALG